MASAVALQTILKQISPAYYTDARLQTLSFNDMAYAIKLLGAEDSIALIGADVNAPVLIDKVVGDVGVTRFRNGADYVRAWTSWNCVEYSPAGAVTVNSVNHQKFSRSGNTIFVSYAKLLTLAVLSPWVRFTLPFQALHTRNVFSGDAENTLCRCITSDDVSYCYLYAPANFSAGVSYWYTFNGVYEST